MAAVGRAQIAGVGVRMVCCTVYARLAHDLCVLTCLCEAADPNDLLRALASCLFVSLTIASRLCIRCLYGGEPRGAIVPVWGQLHAGRTWATEHARSF